MEVGYIISIMLPTLTICRQGTPLCRHIREVIQEIKLIEPTLRANGQKACIIIATDGESSDGNIAEAMKPLEQLPVWVVIRLCTSDDKVTTVNYLKKIY